MFDVYPVLKHLFAEHLAALHFKAGAVRTDLLVRQNGDSWHGFLGLFSL
jgi:hypothetical protein